MVLCKEIVKEGRGSIGYLCLDLNWKVYTFWLVRRITRPGCGIRGFNQSTIVLKGGYMDIDLVRCIIVCSCLLESFGQVGSDKG